MTSLREVAREWKDLPTSLLDAPEIDARLHRDPELLQELANDIARRGVILPLAVVRTGERYEVVDGFRRLLASKLAGLVVVPCGVYPTKELALEGVKYAANMLRETMSAAEEAIFFKELYEGECQHDVDRICALMNKGRPYIEGRLLLLEGDPLVFEAVRADKISLGVAHELNRLPKEDYRRYYLELAIRDGATIALVQAWVTDWFKTYGDPPRLEPPAAPATAPIVAESYDHLTCRICRQNDPRFIPELLPVHTHCRLAILDPWLSRLHDEAS